jgi:isoleucyl-tRNA synthetase
MREQIRLWFYSQCFMAITLDGRQPYRRVLTYEKVYDENGREMHKSWGNAIELNEALERMGADVMRWLYCDQTPSQPLRFGYGMAEEVKKRLLTFWNSVSFFVTYANIAGWETEADAGEEKPLDRWLASRTGQLVRDVTAAYERHWTPDVTAAFAAFSDDLSNWYIRRSRRRFWGDDPAALRALWGALTTALQVVAPVMPFLAEHLWRNLVSSEQSVFLAGWPDAGGLDEELLAQVAEVRSVVSLGRQARDASRLKHRQPLRRLVVDGAPRAAAHSDEVRDELRVKEIQFGEVEATELRVRPNLRVLGPKLGKELAAVRAALEAGEFEQLDGGRFRTAGHELGPDEVLVERRGLEGWSVAAQDGVTVALDTRLDPELELEGRVLDLIHHVNTLRKNEGLELTDRIVLTLPQSHADVLEHEDWIKRETLAVRVETDSVESPQIAKA